MEIFNTVLNAIELVILLLFAVCIFVGRSTNWNFWTRIFVITSLVLINLVQIIVGIIYEQDVFDDIIMLILWGMDIVMYFPDVKERIMKKKEENSQ
ncbi:MAG: hypothetical protein IKJ32_01300 [Clostridia bacterium]|nr:hypothetical protein [Clostridia bacterium]